MGTTLRPKYILFGYMDPWGSFLNPILCFPVFCVGFGNRLRAFHGLTSTTVDDINPCITLRLGFRV